MHSTTTTSCEEVGLAGARCCHTGGNVEVGPVTPSRLDSSQQREVKAATTAKADVEDEEEGMKVR